MSVIVELPSDINIASMEWGLMSFDLGNTNADTGSTQVAVLGPLRRTCAIVSNEREEDPEVMARWRALLHAMRGRVGRIAVWDVRSPEPRGTARGMWTVAAATPAGATSVALTAAGQSGRTVLLGDWIGVHQEATGAARQLLHVQADAVVQGGAVTLQFEPALRVSLPVGAMVVWDRPTCLMRRTSNETRWKDTPGDFQGGYSLDLMESWE